MISWFVIYYLYKDFNISLRLLLDDTDVCMLERANFMSQVKRVLGLMLIQAEFPHLNLKNPFRACRLLRKLLCGASQYLLEALEMLNARQGSVHISAYFLRID